MESSNSLCLSLTQSAHFVPFHHLTHPSTLKNQDIDSFPAQTKLDPKTLSDSELSSSYDAFSSQMVDIKVKIEPFDDDSSCSDYSEHSESPITPMTPIMQNSKARGPFTILKPSKKIQKMQIPQIRKKSRTKKNTWAEGEDELLRGFVKKYGPQWTKISVMMKKRSGKQVRDRYTNFAREDINQSEFTEEEDLLFLELLKKHGKKWSKVAADMPGRTENQVKNKFYCLKKYTMNTTIKRDELRHALNEIEKPDEPEGQQGDFEPNAADADNINEEKELKQEERELYNFNNFNQTVKVNDEDLYNRVKKLEEEESCSSQSIVKQELLDNAETGAPVRPPMQLPLFYLFAKQFLHGNQALPGDIESTSAQTKIEEERRSDAIESNSSSVTVKIEEKKEFLEDGNTSLDYCLKYEDIPMKQEHSGFSGLSGLSGLSDLSKMIKKEKIPYIPPLQDMSPAKPQTGATEIDIIRRYLEETHKKLQKAAHAKMEYRRAWTEEEEKLFVCLLKKHGKKWGKIAAEMPGRNETQVKNKFYGLKQHRVNNTKKREELKEAIELFEGEKCRVIECGLWADVGPSGL